MGATQPVSVAETRAIWDEKASFWDEHMAEGNAFHLSAVAPAAESLLRDVDGRRILDVGCGNGVFSRRLATLGATVIATDFSPAFLERARARTAGRPEARRITWLQVDATDPGALAAIEGQPFDLVVSTMALQDMPAIEPLALASPSLLQPGGAFVAVVPHPCFNTVDAVRYSETQEVNGISQTERGVRTSRYLTPIAALGVGIPGEPRPHHYFERTVSGYLAPWLKAGMVLDGLIELPFRPSGRPDGDPDTDLPVTLAFRFRLPVR